MRKIIIFYALLWLGMNNILYKNIVINHEKMANWKEKFVSRSVEDYIIPSPSDHSKYQGYTYDLSKNNLENNIYIAISDFWDSKCKDKYNKLQLQLLNGCVFSEIDRTYYYLILKLIFIIYNLDRSMNDNAEKIESLMVYSSDGHLIYLNN